MKKEMINLLTVLLTNDIIKETHFIQGRENVNTLEDVAKELVNEYESLKTKNLPKICQECTAYPFDKRGETPLCKTCESVRKP